MQTTATLTYCVEIPVAHGAALYDVEVEAEIVSDDTRPNGYSVVAVSLDTLADIQPSRGRRWSYVEIGRYRGRDVEADNPLAKALTAAIADTLEKSAAFAAKAHDALQEAEYGERQQAAYDRREFNTAAE